MKIRLLIPDELKREYSSFDELLIDEVYTIKLVNWYTLGLDSVKIPKHIVIQCDLSKNLMEIDDSNLNLMEIVEHGEDLWKNHRLHKPM